MTDRDWKVCLSGGELDDAGHVDLERQLTVSPDNLELRIKRLGFLFAKELPRAREVLWLVTQHPEIDLGAVFRARTNRKRMSRYVSRGRGISNAHQTTRSTESRVHDSRHMTSRTTRRRSIEKRCLVTPLRRNGLNVSESC